MRLIIVRAIISLAIKRNRGEINRLQVNQTMDKNYMYSVMRKTKARYKGEEWWYGLQNIIVIKSTNKQSTKFLNYLQLLGEGEAYICGASRPSLLPFRS